jgi:hypothetical protein
MVICETDFFFKVNLKNSLNVSEKLILFFFINTYILIVQRGFFVVFPYLDIMCFDQIHQKQIPPSTLSICFAKCLIMFSSFECRRKSRCVGVDVG